MSFKPPFEIGDVVTNSQLSAAFGAGNMGGMRRAKKTGTLVLISDNTKGLYRDRWHDGILHYTGMGKIGDQVIDRTQNRTLAESGSNGVEVHLFEVNEPTKYTYVGVVELADKPFQETQPDDNGNPRKVWVFPLRKVSESEMKQRPQEVQDSDLEDLVDEPDIKEKTVVHHKVYGDGVVTEIADGKIYIEFENGQNRIFAYPIAFDKKYLTT